jgi:predicted MFS family arabinose efflux permease
VLLGLSAGIYHPSGLSLLSRGVASGERGRAIGIHGVGGNFGEALAPAWAGIFAAHLGWRWGFAAAAILAFACTLLSLTLPNAQPHRHAHARPGNLARALRSFWRSRPLRWLLLSTIASGFVYRGVLTFLPLHLSGSAGGLLGASFLTSLVLMAGIVAQRFGGELADRLPRERLFLAEVALFVPVLILLGLTSGVGPHRAGALLRLPLVPRPAARQRARRRLLRHGRSRPLYGVQFAATFGVGSFATTVGGLFTGLRRRHRRYELAFLSFGAAALLQLVAALGLVRSARTARVNEAPLAERA